MDVSFIYSDFEAYFVFIAQNSIRKELSGLSFEELQALKQELGSKAYNMAMFGSQKKKLSLPSRANKNRFVIVFRNLKTIRGERDTNGWGISAWTSAIMITLNQSSCWNLAARLIGFRIKFCKHNNAFDWRNFMLYEALDIPDCNRSSLSIKDHSRVYSSLSSLFNFFFVYYCLQNHLITIDITKGMVEKFV